MDSNQRIDQLRRVGRIEGISFLLLLGIAMPLKYLAGQPLAVTLVGWAHGVLFLWFCYTLLLAWLQTPLNFTWSAIAFIASLVPFGPFLIDQKLTKFREP